MTRPADSRHKCEEGKKSPSIIGKHYKGNDQSQEVASKDPYCQEVSDQAEDDPACADMYRVARSEQPHGSTAGERRYENGDKSQFPAVRE